MSYVRFDLLMKLPKTEVYDVTSVSSGDILGQVRWYAPWRQYCFTPTTKFSTWWSRSCFRDIIGFIDELMEERKKEK